MEGTEQETAPRFSGTYTAGCTFGSSFICCLPCFQRRNTSRLLYSNLFSIDIVRVGGASMWANGGVDGRRGRWWGGGIGRRVSRIPLRGTRHPRIPVLAIDTIVPSRTSLVCFTSMLHEYAYMCEIKERHEYKKMTRLLLNLIEVHAECRGATKKSVLWKFAGAYIYDNSMARRLVTQSTQTLTRGHRKPTLHA